jgi:hypothetical protein
MRTCPSHKCAMLFHLFPFCCASAAKFHASPSHNCCCWFLISMQCSQLPVNYPWQTLERSLVSWPAAMLCSRAGRMATKGLVLVVWLHHTHSRCLWPSHSLPWVCLLLCKMSGLVYTVKVLCRLKSLFYQRSWWTRQSFKEDRAP